jgi:putative membrane-bound dehydrogenase-like protein
MPRLAVLVAAFVVAASVGGQPPPKPAVADKPVSPTVPAGYHQVTIGLHTFTLPTGFSIELVAAHPQVDRPVTAAFDDKGRLFVADSSGSNAKPADQLKDPTHRVVMLESTKKDGRFDKSTVFADKLSFLQGTMWRDGSLYVATPPTIQKLTDTDSDGKADKREVWFDGGVLTGCANDVHGPYHGPGDGRIYFTKGAFARQELTLGTGKKFVTRAAHIYSAKPDGTDLRVEMTGGMDNPVDVAFNAAGEMFFTTTFFQHPANGKRDGLVHNTYGAVYGKDHDPLNDHVRTRPELSEPMTHLGPAAPAGLHCYRSGAFGDEYRNNLFACQFNMRKVSRHILKEKGSTYETVDSDFVTSDNRDFHPTDVIEDADGSLLIVDTGGWYKLCCPSSVFEKKDVLGAIYRVKNSGAANRQVVELPKRKLESASLLEVRRFTEKFGRGGNPKAVPLIFNTLADEKNDRGLDTALTRALIDIGDAKATAEGLTHKSQRVQRAALAALDQMPGGNLKADDVIPHLKAGGDLGETAWWIATRHPEWGEKFVAPFGEFLTGEERMTPAEAETAARRMAAFLHDPQVRDFLAKGPGSPLKLRAMTLAKWKTVPAEWYDHLSASLTSDRLDTVRAALQTAKAMPKSDTLDKPLAAVARNAKQPADVRLAAFALNPAAITDDLFAVAVAHLNKDKPAALRSAAADALGKADLSATQLAAVTEAIPAASPLDLDKLLAVFVRSKDEAVGGSLVKALSEPKVRAAMRAEQVKPILDKFPAVQAEAAKLYQMLAADRADQTKKLDTLLTQTQPGDVRRGHQVFGSAKAACVSCHKVHYVGGLVGPDLTKIGGIRSDRDLLEAIVFPSASFVRSYEPVKVETKDGKVFSGVLKADAPDEVVLTVNATDEVRIARANVDAVTPGTVSIMPAGLDQQLTPQELADLVAFLKSLR